VDTTVLREDLGFLRRVQALTTKVKELRRAQAPREPERKVMRRDDDVDMPDETDQQEPAGTDESMKETPHQQEVDQDPEQGSAHQLPDEETQEPSSEHKQEDEEEKQ
jgi:hypothetical protein